MNDYSKMTVSELENAIRHHNDLYWNGKETEISDVEYDQLVEKLRELDSDNSLLNEIGAPKAVKTIKHSKPMLSLGKIYSKEDLFKWVRKVSRTPQEHFKIQPKYDGMSGLIENGTLSSRGDGINGQDYTSKLKLVTFDSHRGRKFENGKLIVKDEPLLGELVISNEDFSTIYKNIKSKAGIPFKNQRNGIAGILGTDDVDFYANQGARIIFVDYDINSWLTTAENFEKQWDDISHEIVANAKYPLDGIVIKLADKDYSESLGYTTHHPRGQVAFKFTNQTAVSTLIGVEWSMGKRQIAAIGLIDPVEISGITIKRVKLQLTKPKSSAVTTCLIDGSLQIGDTVVIERAGDIIPHVVSSTPGFNRNRVVLDKCPFCGSELWMNETSIECADIMGGCKEMTIQCILASLITLGFKNVGESYIRLLVNDHNLRIRNVVDLFELTPEQLQLKEYGTRKKEIFFEEIEKAKKTATKDLVLASLNIPTIGKTVAKKLVEYFDWNDLIDGLVAPHLCQVEGIGPTIQEYYGNIDKGSYFSKILHRMTKICNLDEKEEEPMKPVSNKTICFTGKMANKRSVMEEIARSKGFEPIDHVDKNLYMLVCADPNSGSSKLQKAAKYGTRIISEDDFMDGNY